MTRVAILISGRGSNMRVLTDAAAQPGYPARIVGVIADRPAGGLAHAEAAGLATRLVNRKGFATRDSFEAALTAALEDAGADLLCLAGFMRVLSPAFCEQWAGRMLNIHPSLLPAFPGLDTHERALAAGCRVHGCTVHFVTAELDAGPIVAQAAVPVHEGDTPETLGARVLDVEHRLYPHALALVASGTARLEAGRVVVADGSPDAPTLFSPPLTRSIHTRLS